MLVGIRANEREILLQKFQALRGKYTELTQNKARLQQQLILSEEDRLKSKYISTPHRNLIKRGPAIVTERPFAY